MVSLPRRRSTSILVRAGSLISRFTLPRLRADSSSLSASTATRGSSRRAVSSPRRLASASALRRASSSVLRASAASRSRRSRSSSSARRLASSRARLRSSASRTRESARARSRASFSSSVSVRSTMPDRVAGSAGSGFGSARGGGGRRFSATGSRVSGRGCSPGPGVRLRLISTATVLERPCEKFWRTRPCSMTGRFTLRVRPLVCLVVVSLVSLMRSLWFRQIRSPASRTTQLAAPRSATVPPALLLRRLHVSHLPDRVPNPIRSK